MMTCKDVIADYLGKLGEKFDCSVQPNGRLAVVTPYVYPDHDNVELFVRERQDAVVVSDLGETLRRLDTLGMDVLDTPNLAYTARRIADGFNVTIHEGIILKEGPPGAVGQLVFEVLSVCKDVGSLIYGSKAYKPINFKEEVNQFFVGNQLQLDRNADVTGTTGKHYKVAFRVYLKGTHAALVEPLSPPRSSGMKKKVDATFRMWSDVDGNNKDKNVSLLNDELMTFKEQDVAILKRVSAVFRWSHRDELLSHFAEIGAGS